MLLWPVTTATSHRTMTLMLMMSAITRWVLSRIKRRDVSSHKRPQRFNAMSLPFVVRSINRQTATTLLQLEWGDSNPRQTKSPSISQPDEPAEPSALTILAGAAADLNSRRSYFRQCRYISCIPLFARVWTKAAHHKYCCQDAHKFYGIV